MLIREKKKSWVNFNEFNLLGRMQQARNIIDPCSSISPFHGVNLNQVAVVCNQFSLLATSKQTAEDTSDRVLKTKQ